MCQVFWFPQLFYITLIQKKVYLFWLVVCLYVCLTLSEQCKAIKVYL